MPGRNPIYPRHRTYSVRCWTRREYQEVLLWEHESGRDQDQGDIELAEYPYFNTAIS